MTALTTDYYRIKWRCTLFFFTTLFFGFAISSCVLATGNHLRSVEAKPSEVTGTYTLFLYGCRYPDDLENVAILAKEGYPYTFDIYAPSSRYKIKSSLPAGEALREAEQFVSCSVHYQQSRLSAISDPPGNIIGFEVRPLYSPIRFGMYDVLNIQYVNKDRRIVVYIKLDPTVEMELRDNGEHKNRDVK